MVLVGIPWLGTDNQIWVAAAPERGEPLFDFVPMRRESAVGQVSDGQPHLRVATEFGEGILLLDLTDRAATGQDERVHDDVGTTAGDFHQGGASADRNVVAVCADDRDGRDGPR